MEEKGIPLQTDSFNKQRNLTRFILGSARWVDLCTQQNLQVYIEALTGFSYVYHPDGLNTLLSQGCILEMAPAVETVGERYI